MLILTVLVGALGCGASPTAPGVPARFEFDFRRNGPQEWTADFADYSVTMDPDILERDWGFRPLPDALGSGSGLFIQGHNRSSDPFMFFKRRVGGLDPSKTYAARFEIEFATSIPFGCAGPGVRPGSRRTSKPGSPLGIPSSSPRTAASPPASTKGTNPAAGPRPLCWET